LKNNGIKHSEEDIRRTRVITLLFAVISVGVLFGTLFFRGAADKSIFSSDFLCQGFVKLYHEQTVMDVFLRSVSWTSLYLVLLFLMGFCCISQPLELLMLFIRGCALGVSVSYTYNMYGIKGAGISVLMILPHALITSVVLVFGAREAMRCSNLYFMHVIGRDSEEAEPVQLKLYFLRFAVLMAAIPLSAALDSVITYFLTDRLLKI
jgi:stage II sporulation protein M